MNNIELAKSIESASSVSTCFKMYKNSDAGANVVEKFRAVSGTVWFCSTAVIIENTLKEESSQNNHYNDNYNLV